MRRGPLKLKSIKLKFFVAISVVAVVFIGVLILLNVFLYDDYYLMTRRRELHNAYQTACTGYARSQDDLFSVLDALENRSAIRLAIATSDGKIYTSAFSPNQDDSETPPPDSGQDFSIIYPQSPFFYRESLLPAPSRDEQRFRGYAVLLSIVSQLDWDTIARSGDYQFLNVSLHDKEQYLCLGGALDMDKGKYLLAYMPYAVIEQNSSFNLLFLTIAGGCSLLFCLLCAFFISRQFTRPLIEMARVADRMSELDFSNKYEGAGADEIGQLGQALNRLSAYLEQAIGELQQSNGQLAQEVKEKERIDGMRREFIVNVSHELKTPIALIQGYAEGLTAGVADNPEDRKYYCDTIADEANHMNRLVMQLLSLSKLELGAEQTYADDVDLCSLCRDAVQKTSVLCESRGLIVHCLGKDVVVHTDGDLLSQVVLNYLSNAIRYTADGGRIEMSTERVDGGARLAVFNEGDGLPEEEMPKIWEKFYRTDRARSRENGGTGIGLSLVRAIADTLHGDCGAENVEGGIVFWFTVPDAEN